MNKALHFTYFMSLLKLVYILGACTIKLKCVIFFWRGNMATAHIDTIRHLLKLNQLNGVMKRFKTLCWKTKVRNVSIV